MAERSGLIICTLMFCLAVNTAGQGPVRDFQLIKDGKLPLSSSNAATISILGNERFSEMHAGYSKENGELVSIEASPDCWTFEAGTESYTRMSDKLVFHGGLSYSCFRGHDMGGQILMEPSLNPINFLEEDLNTTGIKKRETYSLNGTLSWSFNDRLSAGLGIDYTAADQTKYKDPRFLNVLVDFTLNTGTMYKFSDRISAGGNLFWNHRQEQLSADLFGTVDREYDILVDFGSFYGLKEDFVGDLGYVSRSNARPMPENSFGAAIQLFTNGTVSSFQQLSASWKNGHFGSKTSSSVVFCEFGGPEASYEGVVNAPSSAGKHRIHLKASYRSLANDVNSYKFENESGMNSKVIYIGSNRVLDRTEADVRLTWEMHKGIYGFRPNWIFTASAEGHLRNQHTTVYPTYRDQNLSSATLGLKAERNINKPADCFSIAVSVQMTAGSGNAKSDGSYGAGTSKAKSFDNWLNRQFQYETAPRAGASLEFTWHLLSFKGYAPYLKLSDRFTTLTKDNEYLDGKTRNVAAIVLGCNF